MKTLKIITVTSYILIMLTSLPVWAVTGEHIGYCDNIASTAGAIECLSEHKEKAEKDLQGVFTKLTRDMNGEQEVDGSNSGFLDAHKNWITYRKSECAWEAKTVDVSLGKLQEISCIIRLTEERTSRLQGIIHSKEQPDEVLEFSAFPRWLNGLHNDHKNVIWDVKSQTTYDLNCDGKVENIIQGVSIESKDTEIKETGEEYNINSYIAIVDGQVSGKPKITVLTTTKECGNMPDLDYVDIKSTTEDDKEQSCGTLINIAKCSSKITHDNGVYKIKFETKEEEKQEGNI